MKVKQLLTASIFYFLIIISFSIYWSFNYSDYGTRKGDEFVTLAEALLLITFVFLFLIYFFIARVHLALLISLSILILIVTVFVGTAMLFLFHTTGVPADIICYGLTYGLVGIGAIYLFFYKLNSKSRQSIQTNA